MDIADSKLTAAKPSSQSPAATPRNSRPLLLVIGGDAKIDWFELFAADTQIAVEAAAWPQIQLVSYSDSGCVVTLSPSPRPVPNSPQSSKRTIQPDFLLIRSAPQADAGIDFRNLLIGFVHARVPAVNSLESMLLCLEKPVIYSKLLDVRDRLRCTKQPFPLIEQTYFPNHQSMAFLGYQPAVVKIGTAHSGLGKMRISNADDFQDFRSCMALQQRYVTCEPFVDWDYDFRIQKIGEHYRAFRRFSSNWKGKGMSQRDEDIAVEDHHRVWIDAASAALGMDICALDGIHSKACSFRTSLC